MELRIPTLEQLRTVYDRDLRTAFPAAELKPLKNMEEMWAEGRYRPWCLFDGDDIAGEAFLWLGHPGWALLDYLCVAADRRNGGLGAELDELKALITAGVGTFVCMHMDADIVKALQEDNRCNVLCMGHMASDSIGFNQILDAWEARGVEVTRIGGLV